MNDNLSLETLRKEVIESMYTVCQNNDVNLWLWEQIKHKINDLFEKELKKRKKRILSAS